LREHLHLIRGVHAMRLVGSTAHRRGRALLVAGPRLEHGKRLVAAHDQVGLSRQLGRCDRRGQRRSQSRDLVDATRVDQDPQQIDVVREPACWLEVVEVIPPTLGELASFGVRA
jgi:hypothetical protein